MPALSLVEAVEIATEAQESGGGAVIVTVVASRVSSLQVGGRLVVCEGGAVTGELHESLDVLAVAQAQRALAARRPTTRSFTLSETGAFDVGVEGGDVDLYFEVLAPSPHLVIVGAGHIAVPLARIAKLLDFEVSVIDDRPEYGSRERFPDADRILLGPYRETLAEVKMTQDTCVVLVTRGHVHDQACLEEILDSPAQYIGMIGSKRRVRTVFQHAQERGADVGSIERVHAPIGLDIGAQTPAEIAVAIMAEIINVRGGGNGSSLTLGLRSRARA